MLSILSSVISFLGVYLGFWVAEKQSKHHINRIEALMLLVISCWRIELLVVIQMKKGLLMELKEAWDGF
ncbi:Uncharacterised protein [Avibacterium paragallinarum]|uniref:Uncharacterized protein n=2 Tax=Avibacterium paragallinarum TaxID=728 RepID=A0A380X683_AVIPA|nr:hypothetical protein [Avibacterium paragallinarum]SUU98741.1 Uncharacterised protein [Avibacterium paragallinarum]